MSRFRELTLLSSADGARMALGFPLAALHLLRDGAVTQGATPFPRRLGLFLTNRCNFACPMCAVQDARDEGLAHGGDMPFQILDTVLAECSPHQPVVDLIGGEPLLYPRIGEAVQLASRRRVLAVLTTNGLKLEQQAEALVKARLPMLQISIDGWDEPSQAARGGVRDSLSRIRAGIRAVQQARGRRSFPAIRVLTAITRVNHAHLDRIQQLVAELGVRSWGLSNYFYVNRNAHARHQEFALLHGLTGAVVAHSIPGDVYLDSVQVAGLKASLLRVKAANRTLRLKIAYAWDIDLDSYYSTREAARGLLCELPCRRLDIQTDGRMAVCVSGKQLGQVGRDSITQVRQGAAMAGYRRLYEQTRPMPMCFRCCGLSQSIRFDAVAVPHREPAATARQ
ncbi:radical SAM protein [Paludibaculum fermentans]|uniref:Radical SAM protein n=1 Tax=Paludibaculum fermentans TaxID=1473598 RepID=A0A7S7SMB4_PALFE|nr:radical SAM protein [Paludibaculum fermentans]QOY88915.1 radical SAM protein [Paludibaculum fermentans]